MSDIGISGDSAGVDGGKIDNDVIGERITGREYSGPPQHLTIGGIRVARLTQHELAEQMVADCKATRAGLLGEPRLAISSNGLVVATFHKDAVFRELVRQADIIDADGMPLVIASRLLCHHPLKERVATTDFIHPACDAAVKHGLRFYFLGGKPGVAEKAAENLRAQHPGLEIAGMRNGYFSKDEEAAICEEITRCGTDVLWVGLGSPRQEAFAVEARPRMRGVGWIRTCGGLFDHYVGDRKRAPAWVQKACLEWLYRALQEPRRLGRRYLTTNMPAMYHLLTKTHD